MVIRKIFLIIFVFLYGSYYVATAGLKNVSRQGGFLWAEVESLEEEDSMEVDAKQMKKKSGMEMESKGNNVIDSLLRLGRMYVMFTDKQKMKIPDVKKGIKFGFLQAGISLQNGSAYDLSTVNRASNFVMVENKHTVLTGKFNFTKMEVTFQEFNVRFLLLNVKMGKVTVKLGPHLIPTKLVLAKDDSLAGYKLVSYDFELKMKSLAFQIVNESPLISRVLSKFTQVILNLFIKLVSKVATKAVKDIVKNTLKEF